MTKKNADMTEGRGPMVPVAAFLEEDDAWGLADRHCGVMGHRPPSGSWRGEQYGDWTVTPLTVYASLEEYQQGENSRVRTSALNKLSQEEKIALGLI